MARNQVFKDADNLSLPVPVGTLSGQALRIGGLNAVAQTDEPTAFIAANPELKYGQSGNIPGYTSVKLTGGWTLEGEFTDAEVGDPVYINEDGELSIVDGADDALFGHVIIPGNDTAAVVRISN